MHSKYFLIILTISMVVNASGNRANNQDSSFGSCETLTVGICNELPYNRTLSTNPFFNTNQLVADVETKKFTPLIEIRCHSQLNTFLCSVYAPSCTTNRKIKLPCRSLCESVKDSCEILWNTYGFQWPSVLDCNKFPHKTDGENCISLANDFEEMSTVFARKISKSLVIDRCEPLTIEVCKPFGYENIHLPNAAGGTNQEEVKDLMNNLSLFIENNTCPSFKKLICHYHTPPCSGSNEVILPCRSFCERVKDECKGSLKNFGFDWNSLVNCSVLQDGRFCVGDGKSGVIESSPMERKRAGISTKLEKDKKFCEPIYIPECQQLTYNETCLPNSFRHRNQEFAAFHIKMFRALTKTSCSKYIREFLCAIYLPPCSETGAIMLPCRFFCESVKLDCQKVFKQFGYRWPESFGCHRYPENTNISKCFHVGLDLEDSVNVTTQMNAIRGINSTMNLKTTVNYEIYKKNNIGLLNDSMVCEPMYLPSCNNSKHLGSSTSNETAFIFIEINCRSAIHRISCIITTPTCMESRRSEISKQSLCSLLKEKCQKKLENYNVRWPNYLDCHNSENVSENVTCEPMKLDRCKDITDDWTIFPNFMNHSSQIEANEALQRLWPLIETRYDMMLKKFVCLAHIPRCLGNSVTSAPCRKFCKRAKDRYKQKITQSGYLWPEELDCEKFPEENCFDEDIAPETTVIPPLVNTTKTTTFLSRWITPKLIVFHEEKNQQSAKCDAIGISMCKSLTYNATRMPNFFRHQNETEAGIQLNKLYLLVTEDCNLDMKTFLCSLFLPVCLDKLVLPCKSLCISSRRGCAGTLKHFDFKWPNVMKCSQFPETHCYDGERVIEDSVTADPQTILLLEEEKPYNQKKVKRSTVETEKNCIEITSPTCKDLAYNMANIFNSLKFKIQAELDSEIHNFLPLVEVGCSPDFRLFICSLYFPMCSKKLILPCQSLCRSSRRGCENLMNRSGFGWPDILECSQFPETFCFDGKNFIDDSVLLDVKTTDPPEKFIDDLVLIDAKTTFPPEESPSTSRSSDLSILQAAKNYEEMKNEMTSTEKKEYESINEPVEKCEEITMPLCKDIVYNLTSMPNFFQHDTQTEASLEAHQFYPLVKIGCSPDLKSFICSLYFPMCLKKPVLPCRSLCRSSRKGCENIMNRFGFLWPNLIECSQFPEIFCFDGKRFIDDLVLIDAKTTFPPEESPSTSRSSDLSILQAAKNYEEMKNEMTSTEKTEYESTTEPVEKCEEITTPLCKDFVYNLTSMPNFLQHETQTEAGLEAHQFYPLVKIGCSPDFKSFICSLYLPMCLKKPVLPCRSLCRSSRKGCENIMNRFGFQWPNHMECSQFPEIFCFDGKKLIDDLVLIDAKTTFPPKESRLTSRSLDLPILQAGKNCEKITTPLCRDFVYNLTSMPNFFQHETQTEAGLEAHQFYPLVKIGCSPDFKSFICSLYLPMCLKKAILPCRSLCRSSRKGCENIMNRYGFQWPNHMECSQFPEIFCFDGKGIKHIDERESSVNPQSTKNSSKLKNNSSVEVKCEPIKIPLCKGLSYTETSMSNFLNHKNQQEAGLEIHQFFPLVKVKCSADLKIFLCSLYVPKCSQKETRRPPCRSLCESARNGCEPLMRKFGFFWPNTFDCKQFPTSHCFTTPTTFS